MRVRVYSSDGVTPFAPLPRLDQCEAELVPYVNKASGKSDPLLVFTPP